MILQVKELKKHFPVERGIFKSTAGFVKAVDGVSFSLNEGEVLGIVGESGCGKSTLAKLILRLLEPTAGEIIFSAQIKKLRKDAGIVFQDPLLSLDPKMRMRDILYEPFLVHPVRNYSATREDRDVSNGVNGLKQNKNGQIEALLRLVGLSRDILARRAYQLSGGQRQRVCIARSLACQPKLLILDEPLSSLDLITQKQILELLSCLKDKFAMTYIFISHNIAVVKRISTRVIVMLGGKVVEEGSVAEVFQQPKSEYTKKLLEAVH